MTNIFAEQFAANSDLVTVEDLNAILKSIAPNADIDDEFSHFMQPDYGHMRSLVAKHWDNSFFVYGSIKADWPLCLDIASICASDMRKAALKELLPYRLAFGVLRYTTNKQFLAVGEDDLPERDDNGVLTGRMDYERHAICFVVTAECQIKYYEPQGAGRWMDQPEDCRSLDSFDIS